ncbi:flagellar biosynthesis repressor FlbT [Roseospira goensis]|uniref:Flagellar protein FlbT n=1 Tax=Roseospira goensis TaxID=391922 RepID=A0A7W6S234_9PROT|nr:flagellar biosynthesis repressor FlbT [Roseospira goensis]MBB4287347.1 flagellar protein FlbT [Roseospira goensis]
MPLKITLKPNEKVIIGTAIISNGSSKAELVIHNRVPVVRQKDILKQEEADTPAKQIYYLILNMYLDPANEVTFHDFYFPLLRHMINMAVDERGIDLSVEMSKRIIEGDHYKALKICKKLIEYEAELMKDGERTAEGVPDRAAPQHDRPGSGGDGLHEGGGHDGGRQEEHG